MTASALTRPGERDRLVVKFGQIDWVLTLMLCLLAASGGLMLYSIAGGSWKPWAFPQMTRFGFCVLLMLGLALIDLRVWFAIAYPVYGLGLLMLVGVAVAGHAALGATRWLSFGGERFQPSEVMKIGLVLALARFYHGMPAQTARFSWQLLIPAGLIGVPVLLVAKQPDLGTAILMLLTGAIVVILAGLSWRLIAAGLLGVAVLVPPVIMFGLHGYQKQRLTTFLDPENDPSGSGYHILQSKIALGSGGLLGKGYGLGSQSQLNFLPEKQTDFIFATLAEEFGFVGCVSILILYAAVIFMSLRTSYLSHSHFGRLAAAGVTATFTLYVMINGAMVMGLAPVVGIPLPFMSHGGSSMMTNMICIGTLMAINRWNTRPSGLS